MSEQFQLAETPISPVATEQHNHTALSQEAFQPPSTATSAAQTATEKNSAETKRLEQAGVIPHVEWDVEPEKQLTPQQKKEFEQRLARQGHVQDVLLSYLQYVHTDEKGSISQTNKLNVEKQKQAILEEASNGEFGPASKKAYREVISWLQTRAIPDRIDILNAYKADIPERNFVSASQPTKLRLDAQRLPSQQDVKDLDSITQWFKQTGDKLNQSEDQRKQELIKYIKDNNMPKGWLPEAGADMNKWYPNARRLVQAHNDSLASAGVMHYLNQAGQGVIFDQPTPPGAIIPADGLMEKADLSMPLDWKLSSPADKAKLEALEKWTEQSKKKLEPILGELQTLATHSERLIAWGDEELRGRKVVFDKDNNLVGIIGPNEAPKPGQHVEPANLLESRYDVEHVGNKIVLTQTVQAQNSHWYSYQNMVGVDNAGKQITIRRELNPDDYVLVKHGGEIILKKASDLDRNKSWEKFMYIGGKGLTVALDATMLVTGTIEVKGAIEAVKVAQVAGGVVTRFVAREALTESEKMLLRTATKQFIVNGMRAGVGATGFLNNAALNDSPTVQKIQTARGYLIMADMTASTIGASKKVQAFLENQAKISSKTVGYTPRMAKIADTIEFGNTLVQWPTLGVIGITVGYEKYHEKGSENADRALDVATRDRLIREKKDEN